MTAQRRIALTKDEKAKIARGEPLSFPQPTLIPGWNDGDAQTMELCRKQDWKCFWCGEQMSPDPKSPRFRTKDHIIPLSTAKRGVKKFENIRAVCIECNQIRAEFTHHGDVRKVIKGLQEKSLQQETALRRHKITMASRCYWCKAKFHIREWWHKLRAI